MIARCRKRDCQNQYWRYRRAIPFPGFCSAECAAGLDPQPPSPQAIQLLIHAHRQKDHAGLEDSDEWLAECDTCYELEGKLLDAIALASEPATPGARL